MQRHKNHPSLAGSAILFVAMAATVGLANAAPPTQNVNVVNTPLPVSITGTPNVNVMGAVTTQVALPDHSFSVTHTTTNESRGIY